MNRRFLLICFLLFVALGTYSQQPIIDSLERQLKTEIPDTVRALSMMRLAVNYENMDSAKAFIKYKDAIAFDQGKKLNYYTGLTYFNYSFLWLKYLNYDMTKIILDSAHFYIDKSDHPDVLFRKAQIYGAHANNERYRNNFQESIQYHLKSASIFEKIDKPASLVIAYLNISTFYKEQSEFQKEEEYARKALEISKITASSNDYFKSYAFIALALNMQNRYQEARDNIDSCLKYNSAGNSSEVLVTFYLTGGLTYLNLGKLDSASVYFSRSLSEAENRNDKFSILQSKMQLGRVLTMQKRYREAETLLLSSLEQIENSNEDVQRIVALDYLSRLYDESGDSKKALKYFKDFKNLSDSMSSAQNKQYASDLEVKYETEKKVSAIKQLESDKMVQQLRIRQKTMLNYLLLGSVLFLSLVFVLAYRSYYHKQNLQQQRISTLETEKMLTATEAVLKGEEQERSRLAKDLHDGLGGMLSGIKYSLNTMKGNLIMTPENVRAFERSMDMLDSSIMEMRRVAHNMMPEALVKFGLDTALKDFCIDINASGALEISYQSLGLDDAEMDQTTAITVYRIVQELINNTMKHAEAKTSIVQVARTGKRLTVTIEDDGRGFDTALLSNTKGMGWSNIQNRVEFLKGKLDVRSRPNEGTSVLIELDI